MKEEEIMIDGQPEHNLTCTCEEVSGNNEDCKVHGKYGRIGVPFWSK